MNIHPIFQRILNSQLAVRGMLDEPIDWTMENARKDYEEEMQGYDKHRAG